MRSEEAATEGVLRTFTNFVNFAKFLRTPFLQNTSERLFLYVYYVTILPEGVTLSRFNMS